VSLQSAIRFGICEPVLCPDRHSVRPNTAESNRAKCNQVIPNPNQQSTLGLGMHFQKDGTLDNGVRDVRIDHSTTDRAVSTRHNNAIVHTRACEMGRTIKY